MGSLLNGPKSPEFHRVVAAETPGKVTKLEPDCELALAHLSGTTSSTPTGLWKDPSACPLGTSQASDQLLPSADQLQPPTREDPEENSPQGSEADGQSGGPAPKLGWCVLGLPKDM